MSLCLPLCQLFEVHGGKSRSCNIHLKHCLYRFRGIPAPEIVAHRGKWGSSSLSLYRRSHWYAISVCALRSVPPQRRVPVQMLEQYYLKYTLGRYSAAPPPHCTVVPRFRTVSRTLLLLHLLSIKKSLPEGSLFRQAERTVTYGHCPLLLFE